MLEQLRTIIPTFRLSDTVLSAEPLTEATHSNDSLLVNVMDHSGAAAGRAPHHAICPSCGCSRIHRSRTRFVHERLRKKVTDRRPDQCDACGWRGWMAPVLEIPHDSAIPRAEAALDFKALDMGLKTSQRSYGQLMVRSTIRNLDTFLDGAPAETHHA